MQNISITNSILFIFLFTIDNFFFVSNENINNTCINRVVNENFANHLLPINKNFIDTTDVIKLFKGIPKREILKIKGIDGSHYKCFKYSINKTYITLFQSKKCIYYIDDLNIESNDIKLNKNCNIGMTKLDFCKKNKITINICDSTNIGSYDGNEYAVIFRNDTLHAIRNYTMY